MVLLAEIFCIVFALAGFSGGQRAWETPDASKFKLASRDSQSGMKSSTEAVFNVWPNATESESDHCCQIDYHDTVKSA